MKEKKNQFPLGNDMDKWLASFKEQVKSYNLELKKNLQSCSSMIMAVIWEKWKTGTQPKNFKIRR